MPSFFLPHQAISALYNQLAGEDLDLSTLPEITRNLIVNHNLLDILETYAGIASINCNNWQELDRLQVNLEALMFAYQDLAQHQVIPENQAHEQELAHRRNQVNEALQQVAPGLPAADAAVPAAASSSSAVSGLSRFGIHQQINKVAIKATQHEHCHIPTAP